MNNLTAFYPCANRDAPGAACRLTGTAFCHVCRCDTPTVFLPLSSGHVGNCCAVCHATRKGRPFASRQEYQTFLANARNTGRGPHHGKE